MTTTKEYTPRERERERFLCHESLSSTYLPLLTICRKEESKSVEPGRYRVWTYHSERVDQHAKFDRRKHHPCHELPSQLASRPPLALL
jgi:hypothetical protein